MHSIASGALLLALVASLIAAGAAVLDAWRGESRNLSLVEKAQLLAAVLFTFSSAVLLKALAVRDFSFAYVAQYTDSFLPLFYALTAFWAGQAGSFLFWAWMVALCGAAFPFTRGYRSLPDATKVHFWPFFLLVQAFFLMLLTGLTDPFTVASPIPAEGQGLNPLLQNPGMIFHPPLLFIGYAGFTVPAALAFASWLVKGERSWIDIGHNWVLTSWAFLAAGIILGGWWSYMELGWGGYWAWDPVENASLIPWLSATAYLHTAIIYRRRGALPATNLFLICLTLLLCFFATYLVRSGVVESLHAFGDEGVGTPLFFFLLGGLALTLLGLVFVPGEPGKKLGGLMSRPGLLLMTAWLLLALGLVIALGTLWPVFSKAWETKPVGLTPEFYNRVCLPLFTLMAAFFVYCPWLGWTGGVRSARGVTHLSLFWLASAGALFALGIRKPMALVAASAAIAGVGSAAALLLFQPDRRLRSLWGAYGTHVGVLLMILGVAVSGPCETSVEVTVKPGESFRLDEYDVLYKGVTEESLPGMAVQEARLEVRENGRIVGELAPQRRLYRNSQHPFSEVSTIPSLGDELYATLQAADEKQVASFKVSVHPLVNWIWIGGVVACLLPFLALRRHPEGGKAAASRAMEA